MCEEPNDNMDWYFDQQEEFADDAGNFYDRPYSGYYDEED
jgi:hypothetical protein